MTFLLKYFSILKFATEKASFTLGLIWLLMQIFLYYWYGIRIVHDSHRYLAYADAFINDSNFWFADSAKFYSTYTLLIAFFLYTAQLSVNWLILFQVLLSGIAAIYVYKCAFVLTNNLQAAAFATLLFILWPDLQFWNLYIHTESIYISLSVFVLYFLLTAEHPRQYLIFASLLLIVTFLRPNGVFLTISVGVALLYHRRIIPDFTKTYLGVITTASTLFLISIIGTLFLEIFSQLVIIKLVK